MAASKPNFSTSGKIDILLITFLSVIIYLNSLFGEFVFDDVAAIIVNSDLRSNETSLTDLFRNDYWGTPMSMEASHKSYRPLTVLTFRLNFSIHELDVFGYHLMNILLHTIDTLLVYRLAMNLVRKRSIPLVTALLFAVHPIHTEAVAGVVGRAELLSAFFFLIAIEYFNRDKLVEFTFATVAALLSKEQGITVIGVVAVQIFCQHQNKRIPLGTFIKKTIYLILLGISLMFFRLWIMGGPENAPVFNKFDNPASFSPSPVKQLTYLFLPVLNFGLLLYPLNLCCDWTMKSVPLVESFSDIRNLLTLILFVHLVLLAFRAIKAMSTVQHRKSNQLLPMAISLMILPYLPASNLLLPVGFVLAERTLYLPSIGFCLLIALGFDFLVQRFFVHRKYIQVAMSILLCSFTLRTWDRNFDWRDELNLFTSGIKVNPENAKLYNNIGHYYEKIEDFQQALKYFQVAKHYQPDDLGSSINIGRTLINLGQTDEAEKLLKSLKPEVRSYAQNSNQRLAPSYLSLWFQLGELIARNDSRLAEAERVFLELIEMRRDSIEGHIGLGAIMVRQGRLQEAIEIFTYALMYGRKTNELNYNLGIAYALLAKKSTGDRVMNLVRAATHFQRDTSVDALITLSILLQESSEELRHFRNDTIKKMLNYQGHQEERVWFNLALFYSDDGDNKSAEALLRRCIQKKPDFRSALYNLAVILKDDQRSIEAEIILQQSLKYFPNDVRAWSLLGDTAVEFKEFGKAEQCFKKVLELDPTNQQAKLNLCIIEAKRNPSETSANYCVEKSKKLSKQR